MNKTLLSTLCLAAFSSSVWAQDNLASHQHGHATLVIASQGHEVYIEFKSPAADVLGFEKAASSDDELKQVEHAKLTLGELTNWLTLPSAMDCHTNLIEWQGLLAEDNSNSGAADINAHDAHEHDDEHAHETDKHDDDHAHDADEHGEDEHDHQHSADEHDHEHSEDEHDHEHEHEHAEENHADVGVAFTLQCKQPSQLNQFSTTLFTHFPSLTAVDSQLLLDSGQFAQPLSADKNSWIRE